MCSFYEVPYPFTLLTQQLIQFLTLLTQFLLLTQSQNEKEQKHKKQLHLQLIKSQQFSYVWPFPVVHLSSVPIPISRYLYLLEAMVRQKLLLLEVMKKHQQQRLRRQKRIHKQWFEHQQILSQNQHIRNQSQHPIKTTAEETRTGVRGSKKQKAEFIGGTLS